MLFSTGVHKIENYIEPGDSSNTYSSPEPSNSKTSISLPIYIPYFDLGWVNISLTTESTEVSQYHNNGYKWTLLWSAATDYFDEWDGGTEEDYSDGDGFAMQAEWIAQTQILGPTQNSVHANIQYRVTAASSEFSNPINYYPDYDVYTSYTVNVVD